MGQISQQVKTLLTKSGGLSLILGTRVVEGTDSPKLSSDFYMSGVACVHVCVCVCIRTHVYN